MSSSSARPAFLLRFGWVGALLATGVACAGEPEVRSVRTDGVLEEWGQVPAAVEDANDASPNSAVDLGRIQSLDDPRFLHLTIEMGRPISAQAARGTLYIALDTDGEASTGAERYGLAGTDLVVALSRVPDGAEFGQGAAVYPLGADGAALPPIAASTINLLVAPTHSAHTIEVRIGRGVVVPPNRTPILTGPSTRVGVSFVDGEGEQDRIDPFAHGFETSAVYGPRIGWNQFMATDEGATRIVQWNVADGSFRNNPTAFARVLAGLDPDIILLDEVYGDVSQRALDDFFRLAEFAETGSWQVVLGTSGGRQKSVVASRLPIRPEPSLLRLAHNPDSLDALAGEFPITAFSRLLELERVRGLSVAGAWVTIEGSEVLFVALDLQSRGHDGSPRDRLRELQASVVRDAVAAAQLGSEGVARPVVLGGDLNLVGSRRPLDRIGRALDGTADLQPVAALRFLDQSYATWRSAGGLDFTPGRLDFVLFPTSVYEVDRAFVFDAGDITDRLRASLGVRADDNKTTSDHLPVVVDLRRRDP